MKTSLIKSTFAVAAAFAAGSTLASSTVITTSTNDVYGATFESSTSAVAPLNDFEYQAGDSITNYFHGATEGWFAGEGDASTIEANAGVTGAALKLSTEGQTLENKFSTTAATAINDAVAGAGAVFEAQVKFVASDTIADPFTGGTDANKFAIYALAEDGANSTNLVVYHKYAGGYTNEVFNSINIDTEAWTPVSVVVATGTSGDMIFQVSIDGTPIESVLPYTTEEYVGEEGEEELVVTPHPTWMLTANANNETTLSALCFKGTGYVDDIAVSTLTETSTTYYDVTFDADGGSPAPATQSIAQGGTATKPEDPTKADNTFDGWFAAGSESEFDFMDEINADITLTAHWTAQSSGGDTPVPASDGANTFTVPATEANEIATAIGAVDAATALATDTGKGTTYGQAYALGLLTIDNGVATVADLPAATITFNADGEPVVTFENGMTADADYTVTTQLEKATTIGGAYSTVGDPVALGTTMTDPNPGTAGFYKIKIMISNKSVVE